jgi:hypothetical protein
MSRTRSGENLQVQLLEILNIYGKKWLPKQVFRSNQARRSGI